MVLGNYYFIFRFHLLYYYIILSSLNHLFNSLFEFQNLTIKKKLFLEIYLCRNRLTCEYFKDAHLMLMVPLSLKSVTMVLNNACVFHLHSQTEFGLCFSCSEEWILMRKYATSV